MGATVYYQDNISVSDDQVRVGQHAISPSLIDAYEVKTRLLATHSRWASWLLGGLVVACVVGSLVSMCRLVWAVATGVSEPGNVYAQDWLDFVLPVSFLLASLFFVFGFRGPRLSLMLKLKPGSASEGASIMWVAPEATHEAPIKVGILANALHKVAPHAVLMSKGKAVAFPNSSPPQDALYWDGTTAVTTDYVHNKHNALPVGDITEVRIAVQSTQYAWVLGGFNALFLSIMFSSQLLTNPPITQDGGVLIPRLWLVAIGMLFMMPLIINSAVQAYRHRKSSRIYIVTALGRLGRYNRDVIVPVEVLSTYSEEHANKVRSAIQQAVGWRAHYYGSIGTNEVPGLGQSNA